VIAGDKGLAGGYNAAILNFALRRVQGSHTVRSASSRSASIADALLPQKGHRRPETTRPFGIAQNPTLFNAQQPRRPA
jgi:F0F1-type ATP synthase gamma subunit